MSWCIKSLATWLSKGLCRLNQSKSRSSASLALEKGNHWSPAETGTTRTLAFWGYPTPKEDKVKVTNLKNSPNFQIFQFWNKHYMRHNFSSCLIRGANMKWIWQVLLKIQSGHDSVLRWTDGQMDKVKAVYPPFNFVEAGGIKRWRMHKHDHLILEMENP